MSFLNKNIIITGASSGLGKALACNLAALGANISLAARRLDLLEELREELCTRYPAQKFLALKTDVKSQKSNEDLINQSVEYFKNIHIFIANAGQSMWSRFSDIENPQELAELMQLNYMSMVYAAFYTLPYLRQSHGSFVAISSIQGALPVPFHSGYVASKYAVSGFIEALRLEEPDINFLLAMPSWIAGTELRAHALVGSKAGSVSVNKHHNKNTVSADECALIIIKAIASRLNQIYIPKKYRYISWLRHIAPSLIDKIILKRVKTQLKSH